MERDLVLVQRSSTQNAFRPNLIPCISPRAGLTRGRAEARVCIGTKRGTVRPRALPLGRQCATPTSTSDCRSPAAETDALRHKQRCRFPTRGRRFWPEVLAEKLQARAPSWAASLVDEDCSGFDKPMIGLTRKLSPRRWTAGESFPRQSDSRAPSSRAMGMSPKRKRGQRRSKRRSNRQQET